MKYGIEVFPLWRFALSETAPSNARRADGVIFPAPFPTWQLSGNHRPCQHLLACLPPRKRRKGADIHVSEYDALTNRRGWPQLRVPWAAW